MKNGKRRVFVAVEITDSIRNKLKVLQDELKKTGAQLRYPHPENIHLTIRFLGEVSEELLPGIEKAIEKAVSNTSPFTINIGGAGAFPKNDVPRVIWVGVREGSKKVAEVKEKLDENLEEEGFKKDERAFHSHLTLARVKGSTGRKSLSSWISAAENFSLGMMELEKITLFESILKRDGVEYRHLKTVKLQ